MMLQLKLNDAQIKTQYQIITLRKQKSGKSDIITHLYEQ